MEKSKIIIICCSVAVLVGIIVTVICFNKKDSKVIQAQAGETRTLAQEAEVVELKEEVIKIATDNSIDKFKDKEEEVVKYKDKEITIPKRTVAAAKDTEDGQKQKTGGETATVSSFENDGQYVGIDISSWQGNINWPLVAEAGVQFAMIRVGFRGYAEEGNIKEDAYFRQNIKGAVNNGIKVGIYFYSTARTEEEAIQEAAWVVDKIKSYPITYPVAYDFEEFGMHRTVNLSGEQATNNAIAFLNYVASQGFGTMMYASKNDITNHFQKSRLPYKFWLAHYTSSTDYTGTYQMWQRTSKGSIQGISGYVDMNIAYFGYGEVAKPKHTHDFENGTEIKNKGLAPTCVNAGYKMMRCKECSECEQVSLPATGEHEYEDDWIVDEERSTEGKILLVKKCKNCKAEKTTTTNKRPTTNTVTNNVNTNTTNTTNITNTIDNTSVTNSVENNPVNNTITEVVPPEEDEPENNTTNTVDDNNIQETHTHKYKEEIIKNATCTEKGIKKFTCEDGDDSYEEEIPMISHSYSEGTCSICGAVDPNYKAPDIATSEEGEEK